MQATKTQRVGSTWLDRGNYQHTGHFYVRRRTALGNRSGWCASGSFAFRMSELPTRPSCVERWCADSDCLLMPRLDSVGRRPQVRQRAEAPGAQPLAVLRTIARLARGEARSSSCSRLRPIELFRSGAHALDADRSSARVTWTSSSASRSACRAPMPPAITRSDGMGARCIVGMHDRRPRGWRLTPLLVRDARGG